MSPRRRKAVVFCSYCEQWVGLIESTFNHAPSRVIPKTSRHNDRRLGRLCAGSQLTVAPAIVMQEEADSGAA